MNEGKLWRKKVTLDSSFVLSKSWSSFAHSRIQQIFIAWLPAPGNTADQCDIKNTIL